MLTPRRLLLRLRALLRRDALERSMDDEMRHHLECEIADRVRAGATPDAARRAALLAFGGVERHKESARDARGTRAAHDLAHDLRYAARVLRRNPAFTAAAVLTFALGVGCTTAIYSVVRGVLLRPLPYARPERLVALWEWNLARDVRRNVVSVAAFDAWRTRSRTLDGVAALVPDPATLLDGGTAERVAALQVSPSYFGLLGVRPAIGRDFAAGDEAGGGAHVVLLADGFWRRRFAGDPAIVGRAITLDGAPYTVIGVMPADFEPPRFGWIDAQDLWLPFAATPGNRAWGRFLHVVARLRDRATPERAAEELRAIGRDLAASDPGDRGWSATVVALDEQLVGDLRRPLLLLLGAVATLMAMALVNVGSLTTALDRRREPELAVRRAMGATRGRLTRQLLAQSALVGALGTIVGIVVAVVGVRLLVALIPADVPRTGGIAVDGAVLLVAIGVAGAATALFGATAALRAGRDVDARRVLTGGRVTHRLGGALVVAEVALGLVLALAAGLMFRSFVALRAVPLGFDPSHVVAARVQIDGARYPSPGSKRAFFDAVLTRVRALPGVRAASAMTVRPFGCCAPATSVWRTDRPVADGTEPPTADVRYADADFFRALRIPLRAGTLLDDRADDAPPRAVINETAARLFWPGERAAGGRLTIRLDGGIIAEVAGVVGDVHLADARTAPRPTVYLSAAAYPSEVRDLLVRADGDPDALVAALRAVVASLDRGAPLYQVTTLEGLVSRALARDRFTTFLLAAFAAVALLLASVGIYGVFAADVARRRRELGIRLALGSGAGALVALVVGRGVRQALLGIALGLAASFAAARAMASLLFGVGPADALSFAAVAFLLLAIAAMATLIPALRAARTSPLEAIRLD